MDSNIRGLLGLGIPECKDLSTKFTLLVTKPQKKVNGRLSGF